MNRNATDKLVHEIMMDFAHMTGLAPADVHPRRYLWTDAFAVCNYLELFRHTNDSAYRNLSLHLVNLVHHTLGRTVMTIQDVAGSAALMRKKVSCILPSWAYGSEKS